jgi:Cysteine-rich CPXCG
VKASTLLAKWFGKGTTSVVPSEGLKTPALAAEVCSFPMESGFQCAACGEWNTVSVDESAGRRQSYVEDCQVCCKPNVLRVEYDPSSEEFFITSELE